MEGASPLHGLFSGISLVREMAGALVLVGGAVLASLSYVQTGRAQGWSAAVPRLRSNLGQAILVGLEFLVAADVIATITNPLTAQSVGLLAAIVLIRTALSFALETEIEGCWPWQRWRQREGGSSRR